MKAKGDKGREHGPAGAVDLTEQELSEMQLDQVQGGTDKRLVLKSASTGPKAPSGSAVGMHEISGALVKIN